ncbi:hypothetical protein EYF80_020725 [Liparis tanakae]|uniref:Uncharacterized protein n=1 Tax=Liparis tanakae TaxID=230148 RepID=A0A4Z2HVU2_9TELE|nr:hypothetical protein EYF80_020725 [Liparis tanakae]
MMGGCSANTRTFHMSTTKYGRAVYELGTGRKSGDDVYKREITSLHPRRHPEQQSKRTQNSAPHGPSSCTLYAHIPETKHFFPGYIYQAERSRRSHVELLEGLKALSEVIPQIYSGEGEITSKNEVLAEAHCERIHCHRASRGKSLDLYETLPFPAEDLGVTYEACEAQLCDLGEENKLLLASVPLVNHRRLRGAGEDEVRLPSNIEELHMCVAMPGVKGLVGVEAIAVPAINAGGACLGAVGHDKVPLIIQLEGSDGIGSDAERPDGWAAANATQQAAGGGAIAGSCMLLAIS